MLQLISGSTVRGDLYDQPLPGPDGFGDGFGALFGLFVVVGIGITVFKVMTARRIARDAGMSDTDATTMALLSDHGFEATYLAANLREGRQVPIPGPTPGRTTAERLRELQTLHEQGLITDEERDAARRQILDEL